jgi:hypothetical protein
MIPSEEGKDFLNLKENNGSNTPNTKVSIYILKNIASK